MIAEEGLTLRWIERDGVKVLQQRVTLVPMDASDEEYIAYVAKYGNWRDVPVVEDPEATRFIPRPK